MTENKKSEINYVEPIKEPGEFDVVSYISQDCPQGTKNGVIGEVFVDNGKIEWSLMEERWGLNEIEFAQLAVNTLITRVNFKGLEGNQEKFQTAVDNYKAGRRQAAGPKATKEEIKVARKVAKEASGLTQEELMAAIAAAKAKKGL